MNPFESLRVALDIFRPVSSSLRCRKTNSHPPGAQTSFSTAATLRWPGTPENLQCAPAEAALWIPPIVSFKEERFLFLFHNPLSPGTMAPSGMGRDPLPRFGHFPGAPCARSGAPAGKTVWARSASFFPAAKRAAAGSGKDPERRWVPPAGRSHWFASPASPYSHSMVLGGLELMS